MTSIITDVQQGSKPGYYDVQNVIDALTGRKGQAFEFKTPTSQVTQMTIDDNGVKASYNGVAAPTRVLVDGYDLFAGLIVDYNGLITNIPACWLLCNGTAGTPDLRNRFIVGAGDLYALAATGGAVSGSLAHTHSLSAHTHGMASHTHTGAPHTHSHTHTGAPHSHSHTHTGAAHFHSHVHSGPSHTHTFNTGNNTQGFSNINLDHGGLETTANKAHDHPGTTDGGGTANTGADATGATFSDVTGGDATGATFSDLTGANATGATFSDVSGPPSTNTSDGPSLDATGASTSATVATLPPYYGLYKLQRAA